MRNEILRFRSIWVGILFILLPLVPVAALEKPLFRIYYFNAGYADSSLVILPSGMTVLIDVGSKSFAPELERYLKRLGVRKIDHLVITHPHENHFGGLLGIKGPLEFGHVYVNGDSRSEEGYEQVLQRFREKGVPIQSVGRGDIIPGLADDVRLEVLHPENLKGSVNDSSMVCVLSFQDVSFVFLGDMETQTQKEFFAQFPQLKGADVLTVPHHARSVSGAFVQHFVGKVFIASTAPNSWGDVDESALGQLIGAVYRTDRDGTILVETDGLAIKVSYGKKIFNK